MPDLNLKALQEILELASGGTITKLMAEREKASEALEKAELHLKEVEDKISAALPPQLAVLVAPVAAPAARRGRKLGTGAPSNLKKPDLQELKAILADLPKKTLSIRAEGYDTPNIKTLVEANPSLLRYTKGAWPSVTLLK